jgi:long-subunit acyl-CoA synthetase (AMP-forming)
LRHTLSPVYIQELSKQKPEIIDLFKERIDTLQQQFAHYEQIKRFTLLPQQRQQIESK